MNVWVDDSVGYARSWDEVLNLLGVSLNAMNRKKVRVGLHKAHLPSKTTEYYGRTLFENSWKFSKHRYEKIMQLEKPGKKRQLAHMAHVCN